MLHSLERAMRRLMRSIPRRKLPPDIVETLERAMRAPRTPLPGLEPYTPGRRVYPDLTAELRRELEVVPSSGGADILYKPCEVVLADGTVIDRVYVHDAASYIRVWGIWPEDDRGKNSIDISRVVHVRDSPTRLPPRFANKLYRGGESGMGYRVFTVVFRNLTRQVYITGTAVDFLEYPEGKAPRHIFRVLRHRGRSESGTLHGATYHWCLYGTGEDHLVSWQMPA